MRLDAFLTEQYPEISRSTLQKMINAGQVILDGQIAKSKSQKVNENSIVELKQAVKADISAELKKLEDSIIFEDENVLVLNKPAGILTHAKGGLTDEVTVADLVVHKVGKPAVDNNRFGIVHRLDRATSGVIICAKNPETLKRLQKQFSERKAKKTYLALVEKCPKDMSAEINLPIGRNPKKPSQFRVAPNGKAAVTHYKVLKVYPNGRALLELKPQTGRTHQLRVHLAYINTPIVGDAVYGKGDGKEPMMLHASSLEITIPHGERKIFKAEPPKEMRKAIDV